MNPTSPTPQQTPPMHPGLEQRDGDRPVIVALCGSTRFWRELQEANLRETVAGRIVLAPACNLKQPHPLWEREDQAEELKPRLDALHRRKIELADDVLIVAPGGYIGESTRAEIDYATRLGRPIRYTTEPAPDSPSTDPALLQQALDLIEDLHDPDPCRLDHHGSCQAHFWSGTDCPHGRAAALLRQLNTTEERPAQ